MHGEGRHTPNPAHSARQPKVPTRVNGIDRVSIAIEVFVEAERYALAAGVFIHADEAPCVGVIVPRAQVVEASRCIVCLARVAVPRFLGIRRRFVAEGIEVQRFKGVALRIGDEARAALGVRIDVAGLSVLVLGNQQPHTVWRVRVACRLPRAAVRSRALGDDFAIGTRRVKYPLRFRLVGAALFGAADSSAQGVVAIADFGIPVAHALQPVVAAPGVADGGRGGLLFNQVATPVIFVGRDPVASLLLRELVKLVVGVRGLGAVAILLRAVAHGVILIGAACCQPLACGCFLGQLAVGVVFPRFDGLGAINSFRGLRQAAFLVARVIELRQHAAAIGVRDAGDVACSVVATGAGVLNGVGAVAP